MPSTATATPVCVTRDLNSGKNVAVSPRARTVAIFFSTPIEEAVQLRLAEACLRFSPQVAVRPSEAIFIDITRCRQLYSEETLTKRLQSVIHKFDRQLWSQCRIAFARDAATALACAKHSSRNISQLPVSSGIDLLSPFVHNEVLTKNFAKILNSLKKLGIETLGQFAQIPLASLASRFSKEGFQLGHRIQAIFKDGLGDAWPAFQPPELISESVDLFEVDTLEACAHQETFLFALRPVLEKIAARLHGRGLRATVFEVRFELLKRIGTEHPQRKWQIALPLPQSGARGLFQILRDRLGNELDREPLEFPVNRLTVTILEASPGTGAQKHFFQRHEEESEDFSSLVSRLLHRLGKQSVYHAQAVDRHRPESAWKPTLYEFKPQPHQPRKETPAMKPGLTLNRDYLRSISPERPSRLLKRPLKLSLVGDWIIADDRKLPIDGKWQTLEWVGPERISGEWWERVNPNASDFDRDYYRVTSLTGEQLWVYQNAQNEFYLHGYFD